MSNVYSAEEYYVCIEWRRRQTASKKQSEKKNDEKWFYGEKSAGNMASRVYECIAKITVDAIRKTLYS